MRYVFQQISGNTTVTCIVENPTVKDGALYAVKVGRFTGWTGEEEAFEACTPVQFIAGGNWTLTEFKGQLVEK